MTIIDKKQMWSRFRSVAKNSLTEKVCCGICGKQIFESEENIEYVKTKRGTEIFAHRECIGKW